MSDITKAKLIELVIRALPHSEQIRSMDIDSEDDAIRFEWRGNPLHLHTSLSANTIGDGVLIGDDFSLLVSALVKRVYASDASSVPKRSKAL